VSNGAARSRTILGVARRLEVAKRRFRVHTRNRWLLNSAEGHERRRDCGRCGQAHVEGSAPAAFFLHGVAQGGCRGCGRSVFRRQRRGSTCSWREITPTGGVCLRRSLQGSPPSPLARKSKNSLRANRRPSWAGDTLLAGRKFSFRAPRHRVSFEPGLTAGALLFISSDLTGMMPGNGSQDTQCLFARLISRRSPRPPLAGRKRNAMLFYAEALR
jgi:hypothetical protein